MRRLLIVLVLVMGLVVSLGLGGCGPADGSGAEVVPEEDGTTTEQPAAEEPAVGTRENPLPLGTAAKVGSWEVKITEVNLNANEVIASTNEFNDPPGEGNQFVLVSVEGTYVGEESGTFWDDMSWKYFGTAGNTFDISDAMAVSPNPIFKAGEAFPDASVAGDILFEVPTDQVEGGAIIMEESMSFDDTRVFFATE